MSVKVLSENNIKNGDIILMEEKLHIKLESMDQRIKSSFLCIKKDNFQVIEKKLNEKYLTLRNNNKIFIANGMKINTNSTLSDNKIKDEDKILIFIN